VHTVRNHVQHILDKLGAHSQLEAVAIASRLGLLRSGSDGTRPPAH
jgi:DNA-binding CsgD family transcriptional regulator